MFAFAGHDFNINNATVLNINEGSTGDYNPESSNFGKSTHNSNI
jgi:hypothetical protein